MKRLVTLLMILPIFTFAQDPPAMLDIFEVTVKHGKERQFSEGMQNYKKCLSENNSDTPWRAWWRMQGEGSILLLTTDIYSYADYDKPGTEAEKKCWPIVEEELIPNSTKVKKSIMRHLTDWSVKSPPQGTVVNATFFDVKNPWQFSESIEEILTAVKDDPGYNGRWMSAVGGNEYDFALTMFYDNFADIDKNTFNPWKIYSEKHGEEKLKMLREKMNSSLNNVDSFMYKLDEALSYTPN